MIRIDPRGLTPKQWCDFMILNLAPFGTAPVIGSGASEWRKWAHAVCLFPKVAKLSPPNPDNFSDWRDWAMRFVGIFN